MSSSSGIEAGKAFLKLLVDDAGFKAGIDRSIQKLNSFGVSATAIGAKIGALGAAITAPFAASLKVFSDVGSALLDMQQRTGVSVEALSSLKFAAEQTGASLGDVETGVRKMARSLEEAKGGTGEASKAFSKLGLSVGDLTKLSPEEQFTKISAALNGITDPTQKAALAMEVFGKSGTQLLPMIEQLDSLQQQAKTLGVTMSEDAAKKAHAFGDVLTNLKFQGVAVASALGGAVAPALTAVFDGISHVLPSIIQFIDHNHAILQLAGVVGASLTALAVVLIGLGTASRAAAAGIALLRSGLALLAKNPWVAIAAVAVAALTPLVAKLLGVASATDEATDAAAKQADAQKQVTTAVDEGTKSFDARTEALKRLHAEEEKDKQEKAIKGQMEREVEREQILGERSFQGNRGRALEIAELNRQLAQAREQLADLEAKNPPNNVLVDIDSKIQMEGLRGHIAKLEQEIRSLKAVPAKDFAAGVFHEGGGVPGGFGLDAFGLNMASMWSLHNRAMGEKVWRDFNSKRHALPGFDSPEQFTSRLERQAFGPRSTFNGRIAPQMFGAGSQINAQMQRARQQRDKQIRLLEELNRKLPGAIGPRFKNAMA